MDEAEAKRHYDQAKHLYQSQRPAEALAILDELDKAFPREKNIMYARALALVDLGKRSTALDLCEYLIAVYSDDRGEQLKAQLCPQASSHEPVRRRKPRPLLLVLGALAALAVLGLLAYALLSGK